MKSVTIEQPGQLTLTDNPLPQPAPDEVRIRIKSASLCGSDVHIRHGHNPFATYPRTIGHEFFGVVDAVGKRVDEQQLGQRVVVDPVVNCGHCYPCSVGRPNVCTDLEVIGVHRDGGFSEYVCVPVTNIYPLPATIADDTASLIEPFSIAANICSYTTPREQDVALVYGAGPIGLTVVQTLKWVYGVTTVMVVDRIASRLERARENGADIVLDNSEDDLARLLPKAPTLIIDAACHPDILAEAITVASPAARIGLLGFSGSPSTLIQQAMTGKELSLYSSRLNSGQFPSVIQWFAAGLIKPQRLISHRFDISQADHAMQLFERSEDNCCKVILDIGR